MDEKTIMKTGLLLIHGLTSDPSEVQPLADSLSPLFDKVSTPCLSGHNTDVSDLIKYDYDDWIADIIKAYCELDCDKVVVGGSSMGALLAIILTHIFGDKVLATLCYSPAIALKKHVKILLPLLTRITPNGSYKKPKRYKGYSVIPYYSLNQLMMLQRIVSEITLGEHTLCITGYEDNAIDLNATWKTFNPVIMVDTDEHRILDTNQYPTIVRKTKNFLKVVL